MTLQTQEKGLVLEREWRESSPIQPTQGIILVYHIILFQVKWANSYT